jgi:hypothetical protein
MQLSYRPAPIFANFSFNFLKEVCQRSKMAYLPARRVMSFFKENKMYTLKQM